MAEVIKSVLKTFHPSIDIEQIQLPQKSCASYMRKEELKIVSNAHKSTVHAAEGVGFSLNTDGTKAPKKLGRVVINDVVSLNH